MSTASIIAVVDDDELREQRAVCVTMMGGTYNRYVSRRKADTHGGMQILQILANHVHVPPMTMEQDGRPIFPSNRDCKTVRHKRPIRRKEKEQGKKVSSQGFSNVQSKREQDRSHGPPVVGNIANSSEDGRVCQALLRAPPRHLFFFRPLFD